MGGLFLKLKLWWEAADRTQRMVAVGGGAFLTILLGATAMFATRPQMGILLGGLTPQDQGKVVTALDHLGIASGVDEKGDILVPTDKINETRVKLAASGDLPATNGFDSEEFSKIGLMAPPDVEKTELNQIREQRLAGTIEAIDGVLNAQVHITESDNSPFTSNAHDATAAVTVTPRGGASLGGDQGRVIASLVANSVPGLTLNHVVVLDSKMQMLFDGSSQSTGEGQIGTKLATEQAEGHRNQAQIQSLLDTAFGPGSTAVTVNCELDFDQRHVVTDTVDPVKATTQKSEETMGDKSAGGSATVAPAGTAAPASGAGAYSLTQTSNQVFPNTVHEENNPAAGAVKAMSIDVIYNKDAKVGADQSPIAQKDVEAIVDGFLGANQGKAGFTDKVTPVSFDTSAATAVAKESAQAGSSQRMQQIISMLPIAALLIVGFLVMKTVGKFSKGSVIALAGGGALPVPYRPGSIGMMVGGTGDGGSRQALAGGLDGGGGGGSRGGSGLEFEEPDDEVTSIKGISRKVNVPLEQIKKMSSDRPETVAMLIKGWLLEDH